MCHRPRQFIVCILSLCCGIALPIAVVIAGQTKTPASVRPAHASTSGRAHVPTLCFDGLFQVPLPGKLDYCLGLRDWDHGHYRNGMEFLKLAAGWGNKNAQYTLGLIYYGGNHVAADPVLALAWLKLANERHNDTQIQRAARSAFKWATPAQRQRAEQLFDRMVKKYGDTVAAVRAAHRLAHWKFNHGPFASGCLPLYPAQAYALRRVMSVRLPVHPTGKRAHSLQIRCMALPQWRAIVHKSAKQYFRGLNGAVSVGPLEVVPAPAASSGH